jgi:hypothetical protein
MGLDDQPKLFPDAVLLPRFEYETGTVRAVGIIEAGGARSYLFRLESCPGGDFSHVPGSLVLRKLLRNGFGPVHGGYLERIAHRFNPSLGHRVISLYPVTRGLATAAIYISRCWVIDKVPVFPGYLKRDDLYLFYKKAVFDNETWPRQPFP